MRDLAEESDGEGDEEGGEEGGEGGDRVEDRGTLELQAGEGEELHLAECSAWNRGRL